MKHLANMITLGRIICALILLFLPFHSAAWSVLYLVCGLSDMIDGTVARKTGSAGTRGAALDSAADAVFFVVCLIKILPIAGFGRWVYPVIAVIAGMKAVSLLRSCRKYKQPMLLHTAANKLTGFLLFLLPFCVGHINTNYAAIPVCAAAAFAAAQECRLIGKAQSKT